MPVFALVGLLGLGAVASPAYAEYGATDSSSSSASGTTYTKYGYKITQKDYKNHFKTGAVTSTPKSFNLGGKNWNISATGAKSDTIVMDYESYYSKYDMTFSGRGLKFGDSDHPVRQITLTLPQSELDDEYVSQIDVNCSVKSDGGVAYVLFKVGDTVYGTEGTEGHGRLISNEANLYNANHEALQGDVTIEIYQPDTSSHALFV